MVGEKRIDQVEDAIKQMQKVIMSMINESVRGSFFEKAIECLKEMRKACINEEEPEQFNKYLIFLKDKVTRLLIY